MGIFDDRLKEAELQNRLLKAQIFNAQLKKAISDREEWGKAPPEARVSKYQPFPEDALSGLPAPSTENLGGYMPGMGGRITGNKPLPADPGMGLPPLSTPAPVQPVSPMTPTAPLEMEPLQAPSDIAARTASLKPDPDFHTTVMEEGIKGIIRVIPNLVNMTEELILESEKNVLKQQMKGYEELVKKHASEKDPARKALWEKKIQNQQGYVEKAVKRILTTEKFVDWSATVVEKLQRDPSFKQKTGFAGYLQDVGMVVPQVLSQIIVASATGGWGGMLYMGGMIAGEEYQELRKEDVPVLRAAAASLVSATTQAPMEKLSLGFALKTWNPGRKAVNVLKEMGLSAVAEFSTEALQLLPSSLSSEIAKAEGKTQIEKFENGLVNFWEKLPETGKQMLREGLVAAPIGGVLGGGGAMSRPWKNQGPVRGGPAGSASPGGRPPALPTPSGDLVLPAPTRQQGGQQPSQGASAVQGGLFDQPEAQQTAQDPSAAPEGTGQQRQRVPRETMDPLWGYEQEYKKQPDNKYLGELIKEMKDPVIPGFYRLGRFYEVGKVLTEKKIPYVVIFIDINNLAGGNTFQTELGLGPPGTDVLLGEAYGGIIGAKIRDEGGINARGGERSDELRAAIPYVSVDEARAMMRDLAKKVENVPGIKAMSGVTHEKNKLPDAGALNFDWGVAEGGVNFRKAEELAAQEMAANRELRKEKLAKKHDLVYDKRRKIYVKRTEFETYGTGPQRQPTGSDGTSVPKGREPGSEAAGQRVPEKSVTEAESTAQDPVTIQPEKAPVERPEGVPETADMSQADIDFVYDHLPAEQRPKPSGRIVKPLTPDEKRVAAQETYEKELEKYNRWLEWEEQFPAPYGGTAKRMAQLIRKKGQVIPKGEKLQLSEHIPKKYFGVASDDLANMMRDAGWSGESENDLMAILADYPERVLIPKPPGSVKEPAPGYSREQRQLDQAKEQEDMFAPQEEKAQRELKRIQAQRAQAAKARDKGTEGLPLFEGPAKGEAEQTSMFGDVVKEPGAQYDAETETINLKTIKLRKDSPLKPFEGRDIQVPAGLEKQLRKHKGTKWYDQTIMSLEYQAEIRDLIAGREPEMGLIKRLQGGRMYSMLKGGMEGVWKYARIAGVIGTPSKPGKAVNSSLINCEPSKACAKFCYVVTGIHYQYGTSRSKSELINYMAQADPERLGKMIAQEYMASLDYETDKALRFFDKGDITPEWVKVIQATNDAGVRVHIFSRKPRLLKQVGPKNVRLLSIDNTGLAIAEGNDLPIAFIYTGQEDIPHLERLKDRIQVILPVILGKRVMKAEEVAKLPAWTKPHQCPIDNGTKKLPVVGSNTGWTCPKCDRGGGVACYRNQPTTEFRATKAGRVTQKSAKELMKYAEENLTPEQYKRVLGQLRSIIKGIKDRGETGIGGSDVQVPGTVSEAPGSFKPAPGSVKAPPKAEQLDLFKQLKKDIKEVVPVPETKLDPAIKKAREKAKPGWKAVFADKARISLKGISIRTEEGRKKFLEVIQAFRNPMYETYRIIYLRDGVILDYDSFSSQIPGESLIHPVDPHERIRWYYEMRNRMERLGANEVMQLHNHPAQNVEPSLDDLKVTKFFKGMFGKAYKGHVITNHRIGSILDPNGTVKPFDITDGSPDPYQPGKKIKNADQMMGVAASIGNQEDHIGLSFFNSQLNLVGVSSLHVNDFLKNPKQFIATVHNMARDRGARSIVASPPPGSTELGIPDDLATQLYDLKVKGEWLFFDTVYLDEMTTSQMLWGARDPLGYDEMKLMRVRESLPAYEEKPKTKEGKAKKEKKKKPRPPEDTTPKGFKRAWKELKADLRGNRKRVPPQALPIYDKWAREIQVGLFRLNRLENELQRMGSKAEQDAVPFVLEETGVPEAFNRPDLQKLLDNPESRKRIDAMADKARAHYKEMQDYMEENSESIPHEWIENYVTHLWDLSKNQSESVASWFSTTNQFLKKRTIATLAEGITERGLTPKTTNIVELISLHGQVVIRTTQNKMFLDGINALEDAAGFPLIMPAHLAPKHWKIIDHPALMRYKYMGEGEKKIRVKGFKSTIREYVDRIVTIEGTEPSMATTESAPVKKLEEVITSALETRGITQGEAKAYLGRLKAAYSGKQSAAAGGATGRKTDSIKRFNNIVEEVEQLITVRYPKLEKRPVKYHPDLDPMMQAVFFKPWRPHGKLRLIVDSWEGSNAILKQTQLSISFFHHIALGEAAISIMGPLKTAQIALNLKKMWEALNNKEFDMFLGKWEVAEEGILHGLMLEANSDVQRAIVDRILQGMGDYVEKHAGKELAAPLRAVGWGKHKWDQALWDYYHNNLKLYAYEHITSKVMPKYLARSDATPEGARKRREEIAAFVNDTFGGQNLLRQMANPGFMRAFRATMLSPDWLVSTLKQAIAIVGLAGVHPELWSLRMKMGATFWVKASFYFGGASILLNYLLTKWDDAEEEEKPFSDGKGKWMWENDPGHETHLFLGRGPDGVKIYVRHGKQFRELPEFLWDSQAGEASPITAAMKKMGGKAAPVPQIVSVLATGKTLSGFDTKELRDKEGWAKTAAIFKFLSTSWLPFSFSSIRDEKKGFHPIQFGLPTSMGMTRYKTRKLMKTALLQDDLKFLKRVWLAAIENNLPDVEFIFEQTVKEVMADAQEEYQADLRREKISDKELEKIRTKGQVNAASQVVQQMVRKKKSLERQKNLEIMTKRLEGYLKRKNAMEEELSPKERDRLLNTLRIRRDKYELELKP